MPVIGSKRKANTKMVNLNGDVVKDLGNSMFHVSMLYPFLSISL